MRCFIALHCIALALAGCATGGPPVAPEIRTVETRVPVMVTCAAAEPVTKPYPDTDAALLAAANIFEQTKLLMAGRALRGPNEAILRAARKGCEGVALETDPPVR